MQLNITLPCKPVVKQYLINKYGSQLHLPDDDWIKLLIESYLSKSIAEQDSRITLQHYTQSVSIPISYKTFELHGDALSKTAIRAINNRIEDVIHQQLFQHLEFYVHVAHYKLRHAIIMFQDIYALPEDVYPRDTITKYYQRRIQPYVNSLKFASANVQFKSKRKYHRAA